MTLEVRLWSLTPLAAGAGAATPPMILLAFRHGLRAAEVCDLRWDQVDFSDAVLHVRRVSRERPPWTEIQQSRVTAAFDLQPFA
jgi:integrase